MNNCIVLPHYSCASFFFLLFVKVADQDFLAVFIHSFCYVLSFRFMVCYLVDLMQHSTNTRVSFVHVPYIYFTGFSAYCHLFMSGWYLVLSSMVVQCERSCLCCVGHFAFGRPVYFKQHIWVIYTPTHYLVCAIYRSPLPHLHSFNIRISFFCSIGLLLSTLYSIIFSSRFSSVVTCLHYHP